MHITFMLKLIVLKTLTPTPGNKMHWCLFSFVGFAELVAKMDWRYGCLPYFPVFYLAILFI